MKKVLVTGCSGFVGRNMVKHLLKQGHTVAGLSRTDPDIPGLEFIQGDILTMRLDEKFIDYDIIHCAAKVEDGNNPDDYVMAMLVNVLGTQRMLAVNPDRKFVHISSSSVYSEHYKGEFVEWMLDHEKLPEYTNVYSSTKALAERAIVNKEVARNVAPVILRPHGVYGEDDTTLFPKLMERVKAGKLFLPGGGKAVHALTNVKNLVQATELALDFESSETEIFNITDSDMVTIAEAVNAVSDGSVQIKNIPTKLLLTLSKITTSVSEYQVRQLSSNKVYSIEKARKLLGYNPTPFTVDWVYKSI